MLKRYNVGKNRVHSSLGQHLASRPKGGHERHNIHLEARFFGATCRSGQGFAQLLGTQKRADAFVPRRQPPSRHAQEPSPGLGSLFLRIPRPVPQRRLLRQATPLFPSMALNPFCTPTFSRQTGPSRVQRFGQGPPRHVRTRLLAMPISAAQQQGFHQRMIGSQACILQWSYIH